MANPKERRLLSAPRSRLVHLGRTLLLHLSIGLCLGANLGCFLFQHDDSQTPHRVAIIGDFGVDSANQAAVATLVKSWNPEAIFTLGDNNYPSGAQATIDTNIGKYFADYILDYSGAFGAGSTTQRFYPSLGNHDWDTDPQPYYDYFNLGNNERYYDVRIGDAHFFIINSNASEPDGIGSDSAQAAWLRSGLSSSVARFKFVLFHHPPYTSSGVHADTVAMRWPFKQWGATAVLAGHNHFYERLLVDGIYYFVNGSGGANLYSFSSISPYSQLRYADSHGAQLMEINPSSVTLKFINTAGQTTDSVEFVKPFN